MKHRVHVSAPPNDRNCHTLRRHNQSVKRNSLFKSQRRASVGPGNPIRAGLLARYHNGPTERKLTS